MSVTDAEYAMLSNAVYHDKNFIPPENYGFTYIRGEGDDRTGFYGEIYQRGKDIVFVFRGSDNILNFEHDIQWGIINKTPPPELDSAMAFYNNSIRNYLNKDFYISMTGHSLGGSAVQYVNARLSTQEGYQVPGVAFAPAGVAELFPQIAPNSIAVRNYARKGDIVPGIKDKQLGYETILLPFKNELYHVEYKENGIGEIVGTRGEAGIKAQHSILGYWVDIGYLKTRIIDKPLYLQDQYRSIESSQSVSVMTNYEADKTVSGYVPTISQGEESKQYQSHYFQLPDQQLWDTKNIADLEKQSFDFNDVIGYRNNIILQVGNNRSYKTESYSSNIA